MAGDSSPDAIVVGTGSELHLAVAAREALAGEGKQLSVVSIPSVELFHQQGDAYRQRLFPPDRPVATIEAGITAPWRALVGPYGLTLGIDHFGASAPAGELGERFGFTAAEVVRRVREWLG